MSEEKKLFSTDQWLRIIIGVFAIGAAWSRLEYKMDQMNEKTNSMFREYIIANDADKKAITVQMTSFKEQLDLNSMAIKAIADFIKPEDVEWKEYKRR